MFVNSDISNVNCVFTSTSCEYLLCLDNNRFNICSKIWSLVLESKLPNMLSMRIHVWPVRGKFSPKIARAKQIRAFCPPEIQIPVSPTWVSTPFLISDMSCTRLHSFNTKFNSRLQSSSDIHSSLPKIMFPRIVVSSKMDSCGTYRTVHPSRRLSFANWLSHVVFPEAMCPDRIQTWPSLGHVCSNWYCFWQRSSSSEKNWEIRWNGGWSCEWSV